MKNVCEKKRYSSEQEVKFAANSRRLQYYVCPICKTYHLTSSVVRTYNKDMGRLKGVTEFINEWEEKERQSKEYLQQFNIKR